MSMVIFEKVMITPQQKVLYICLKADNFFNTEVGFELKSLGQIAVYVPHSAKGIRAICLEIHTGEGQMSTTETGQITLTAAYFLQTAGDDGTPLVFKSRVTRFQGQQRISLQLNQICVFCVFPYNRYDQGATVAMEGVSISTYVRLKPLLRADHNRNRSAMERSALYGREDGFLAYNIDTVSLHNNSKQLSSENDMFTSEEEATGGAETRDVLSIRVPTDVDPGLVQSSNYVSSNEGGAAPRLKFEFDKVFDVDSTQEQLDRVSG